MKIRATSSLKFVTEQKNKVDLKPSKGESLDNLIEVLSDLSDNHKWHGIHSQESSNLEDCQVVLVDSSFGVRAALVHAYPMGKGFQDILTGTDHGEKSKDGEVFNVTGWRYLPSGKKDCPSLAVEEVTVKKHQTEFDEDLA